eukprot:tig00021254_g19708.t1
MDAEDPPCAFDQLDDAVLGQIFEAVGLASAYGHAQLWSLCRRFRRVLLEVRWAALDLGPAALGELAGASAEAHVALTRRICTLVSRHACGPNETGAAPRTSPRAWPFSGLASARWPRLVNLAELRRLSVSLELPPRSSGTSERTHALLRLAQPAWARDLLACALGALRCPVAELAIAADELPADEDLDAIGVQPLHEGAADALLSVLGEGPHPSVSRLELTARRFLGYEGHHLRSLLGRLPALAALALRTQPDDALDAGRRGAGGGGAGAAGLCAGSWRAGWGRWAPWGPWRGSRCPRAGRPRRRRPPPRPPLPRLPLDCDAEAPVFPVQEAARALEALGRRRSCGSSQWPSTCAATGPTGPAPSGPSSPPSPPPPAAPRASPPSPSASSAPPRRLALQEH